MTDARRDPDDLDALREASDILGIDALLSAEERSARDRVRAFVDDEIRPHIADWFDRAHFQKYGDSALIFEVVYFVLSADYNQYMDIQQQINFTIMDRFAELGIAFAYPTQTLYVHHNEPAEAA